MAKSGRRGDKMTVPRNEPYKKQKNSGMNRYKGVSQDDFEDDYSDFDEYESEDDE